ncbi:hypothetical protein PF004_g13048 [Phytophthora fragariae]|uniref:Integrase catalytic domain-containing protein n=1 Tax=Phytophthora fragariae TaxID=53985 RepID=A0A6G0NTB8_9STRA|nr:hypothetical protein PF004_g13048 [Phytophthora fragariae]
MYASENQAGWDDWLPCAVYAYNGARHSTTGYSPNELLMGRRLRAPNELLRASGVTQIGQWAEYHKKLVRHMARATEIAQRAAAQNQERRARYYNHRVRNTTHFKVEDLVWVLRPPRGRGITKLAHQWVGPAKIEEDVGYDNWRVTRLDDGSSLVVHSSFLTPYHCPDSQLQEIAQMETGEYEQDGTYGVDDVWLPEPVAANENERVTQPPTAESSKRTPVAAEWSTATGASALGSEPERQVHRSGHIARHVVRAPVQHRAGGRVGPEERQHGQDPSRSDMAEQRATTQPITMEVAARPSAENDPDASGILPVTTKRKATSQKGAARKRNREANEAQSAKDAEAEQLCLHVEKTAREARAARRSSRRGAPPPPGATEANADVAQSLHDDGVPNVRDLSTDGVPVGPVGSPTRGEEQVGTEGERANMERRLIEEEDLPTAAVQALRGRGRPRKQPTRPSLLQQYVFGPIIELGRRRRRNRVGRYELQYEVEYRKAEGAPPGQKWLGVAEYEELLDVGKMASGHRQRHYTLKLSTSVE